MSRASSIFNYLYKIQTKMLIYAITRYIYEYLEALHFNHNFIFKFKFKNFLNNTLNNFFILVLFSCRNQIVIVKHEIRLQTWLLLLFISNIDVSTVSSFEPLILIFGSRQPRTLFGTHRSIDCASAHGAYRFIY